MARLCTRVGEEVLAMELEGACRGRDAEGDNGEEQAQRVTQVHCYLHILNNTIYHMVLAMSGKSDTNDRNSGNTAYGIKLEARCKLFNVHAKDIAWPDSSPITNDTRFGSYCSAPVAVLQHHRRMADTCRKYLALPKAHQQAAIAKLVSKVAPMLVDPEVLIGSAALAGLWRHSMQHEFKWAQDEGSFHMLGLHQHMQCFAWQARHGVGQATRGVS